MSASLNLELEGWAVLDSQYSQLQDNFNTLDQSNAAIYSPFSNYITVHSPATDSLPNYELKKQLFLFDNDNGGNGLESFPTLFEQHGPDFLSCELEESYVTDGQFRRQVFPLLPLEEPTLLVSSSQRLDSDAINMRLPSHWHSLSETHYEDSISSTVHSSTSSEEIDVMGTLSQLCDTLGDDMIIDHADLAAFDSSLPAMTLEDVESFLSCESPSSDTQVSVWSHSFDTISSLPPSSPTSSTGGSASSAEWIGFGPRGEKKQRKKEQNKTAALRYRQKKRSEHGSVATEYEVLETRNTELKTKVSDMMKEIAYLKELIAEIYA